MHSASHSASTIVVPPLALLVAGALSFWEAHFDSASFWPWLTLSLVAGAALIAAALEALRYAELIGARLGEPLGTLMLTIAVTIIEVSIISASVRAGDSNPTIAREAVFSAVMLACNGLVGACLLVGALRHHEQEFQPVGTSAYLAVLIALSVITLVLPDYTTTTEGPTLSSLQLGFVSVMSILLYAAFLFIQTVRHRSHFLEVGAESLDPFDGRRPTGRKTIFALAWLILSLLAVVLLAERVEDGLGETLLWAGVADESAVMGAILALLVLLPESLSAIRAAQRNALQTSLNQALGSVLATVGLTVPAVAAMSLVTGKQLILGLDGRDTTLLALTLLLSVVSFGSGRTNVLTGLVHLVVFATYVFLLFVP